MAYLFLDDTLDPTRLEYKDTGLNSNYTLKGCYNDTATSYDTGLTLLFSGVSVEFYGVAGGYPANPLLQVMVDGGPIASYNLVSRDYIDLLYRSPTLDDGPHNITFVQSIANPTMLDFMLVTTGSQTPLTGNDPIIVDDDDPSIVYEGYWTSNDTVLSNPNVHARKPFKGTTIGIYGIFDQPNAPKCDEVSFTIDGVSQRLGCDALPSTTDTNHLWYYADSLAPTQHTLVVQSSPTSSNSAGMFSIDYILYSPLPFPLQVPQVGNATPPSRLSMRPSRISPSLDGESSTSMIGPFIVIALVAFLLLKFRRRLSSLYYITSALRLTSKPTQEQRPEYVSIPSKDKGITIV
ncbi:hypothetical protein H0H92_015491 [Tricholoma furcatifolium]|nr:hypothetical protein H0H92_015491 [Tricholoma furcatifolium]